ncbi:MAG: Sigma 54 modulation protein / ribosomal protein [Candidatus Parcubacteria bacterium]|jgi:ribosomal subunit interface protein
MTSDIEEYLTSRVSSVEKFLQIKSDENVLVECEIDRSTHHKKGEVFRVEINLSVGGRFYRSEETNIDVCAAIDIAKDQLEKQIRRSKTKRSELFEKGARAIKSILRRNNNG